MGRFLRGKYRPNRSKKAHAEDRKRTREIVAKLDPEEASVWNIRFSPENREYDPENALFLAVAAAAAYHTGEDDRGSGWFPELFDGFKPVAKAGETSLQPPPLSSCTTRIVAPAKHESPSSQNMNCHLAKHESSFSQTAESGIVRGNVSETGKKFCGVLTGWSSSGDANPFLSSCLFINEL